MSLIILPHFQLLRDLLKSGHLSSSLYCLPTPFSACLFFLVPLLFLAELSRSYYQRPIRYDRPHHLSLRFFTRLRRSSCLPTASAVRVQLSHAYRKIDKISVCISLWQQQEIYSRPSILVLVVAWAILESISGLDPFR